MMTAFSSATICRQALDRRAPGGSAGLPPPNQKSILEIVGGTLCRMSGGRRVSYLEKFYIVQDFRRFTPETLVSRVWGPLRAPLVGKGQ